jgi:hypothetical protein
MSKITLSGNASGTGMFTLASPNSNSDRTLNLPDAGGTMVLDTATQTLTNKTLTTPNIDSAQFATVTGTAPLYACRAWVNFNGTTSPPTIRASGNVSSVTKTSAGDYTVNFTTAMPDADYAGLPSYGFDGSGPGPVYNYLTQTASQFRFRTANSNLVVTDYPRLSVAIFR